jgi:hypothetical protein
MSLLLDAPQRTTATLIEKCAFYHFSLSLQWSTAHHRHHRARWLQHIHFQWLHCWYVIRMDHDDGHDELFIFLPLFYSAINALLVLVIIPATVIYQFRLLGKKARVMITSFSPRGKKKTEPSKKKGGAPLHVNLHQANQPRTSLVVSSSGKLTAAEGSTTPCMSPANSRSTTPNHATRLLASTDSPKGGQLSPPPSTSQQ